MQVPALNKNTVCYYWMLCIICMGSSLCSYTICIKKITVYLDTVESLIKLRDPHLVAQPVKNLPAMRETQVQSLGWEDPLEKATATHSSIFAWRIPWTEDPGGLYSTGPKESDMIEWLTIITSLILSLYLLLFFNVYWKYRL